MTAKSKTLIISVVIPMHNEEEVLEELFSRLVPTMENIGEPFEIVGVDDGSTDDTWLRMKQMSEREPRFRPIRLSRNFGKEIAMTAGLDTATGQAIVFIDADLQDPPELIAEFVEHWRRGYQNVYGVRVSRKEDSFMKRVTASSFYTVFNLLSSVPLPAHAGDFRLLGPEAVAALRLCRERKRFMKGLYAWVGFSSVAVPFDRPKRFSGKTKFGMRSLMSFAFDGIISHSTALLRALVYVGLGTIFLSAILASWILIEYFMLGQNPRGFYVSLLVILFLFSLNFIFLGTIGEYIGRIFDEVKGRPLYLLRDDNK